MKKYRFSLVLAAVVALVFAQAVAAQTDTIVLPAYDVGSLIGTGNTWLLWATPALLLMAGLAFGPSVVGGAKRVFRKLFGRPG